MAETLVQAGGSHQRSSVFIYGFDVSEFDERVPIWYTTR